MDIPDRSDILCNCIVPCMYCKVSVSADFASIFSGARWAKSVQCFIRPETSCDVVARWSAALRFARMAVWSVKSACCSCELQLQKCSPQTLLFTEGTGARREGISESRGCFCILPNITQQLELGKKISREIQAEPLNLHSILHECAGERDQKVDSLPSLSLQPLLSDVIKSQWERALVLVGIQAPPPAPLCMAAHMVLQHHIFTMRYSAAERGRDTEILLLACVLWCRSTASVQKISSFTPVSIRMGQFEERRERIFCFCLLKWLANWRDSNYGKIH